MGSLKTLLLIAAVIAIGYGVGRQWKLKPETPQNHVVHKGEYATLVRADENEIWIATDRGRAYDLQVAMTRVDRVFLNNMEEKGIAFRAPVGGRVRVVSEDLNRREIELLDGPQLGKRGWVEFEYLKAEFPARP